MISTQRSEDEAEETRQSDLYFFSLGNLVIFHDVRGLPPLLESGHQFENVGAGLHLRLLMRRLKCLEPRAELPCREFTRFQLDFTLKYHVSFQIRNLFN